MNTVDDDGTNTFSQMLNYPDYQELEEYKLPDDGFFDIVTIQEEPEDQPPSEYQNQPIYLNITSKRDSIKRNSLPKMSVVLTANTEGVFRSNYGGVGVGSDLVIRNKESRSDSINSQGGKRKAPPKPPRLSRSDSSNSSGSGGRGSSRGNSFSFPNPPSSLER